MPCLREIMSMKVAAGEVPPCTKRSSVRRRVDNLVLFSLKPVCLPDDHTTNDRHNPVVRRKVRKAVLALMGWTRRQGKMLGCKSLQES